MGPFAAVGFERRGEPFVELHFFSICGPDAIRLAGEQALARRQTNEVLRRFGLAFEVLVLRLDVIDRFLRRMRLPVANKGRVRIGDVIEQVLNRLVQGFRPHDLCARKDEKNQPDEKTWLHTMDSIVAKAARGRRSLKARPG